MICKDTITEMIYIDLTEGLCVSFTNHSADNVRAAILKMVNSFDDPIGDSLALLVLMHDERQHENEKAIDQISAWLP